MTQDLEQLEADYAKLGETIKRMKEEKESGLWEPQEGVTYFSISPRGIVFENVWEDEYCDHLFLARGNVFRTKEEAEKADRKRILETKLHSFTKGFKPDWGGIQHKFYIYYDYNSRKFYVTYATCCDCGQVTFKTRLDAENAIKEMGDELYELFGVTK